MEGNLSKSAWTNSSSQESLIFQSCRICDRLHRQHIQLHFEFLQSVDSLAMATVAHPQHFH